MDSHHTVVPFYQNDRDSSPHDDCGYAGVYALSGTCHVHSVPTYYNVVWD